MGDREKAKRARIVRRRRRPGPTLRIVLGISFLLFAPVMPAVAVWAWLDERAIQRDLRDGPVAVGTATRGIKEYTWPTRGNHVVVGVAFTDRSGQPRYGDVVAPTCARDVDGKPVDDGAQVRVRYDATGKRGQVFAADAAEPCSETRFDTGLRWLSLLFGLVFAAVGVKELRGGLRQRAQKRNAAASSPALP